MNQPPNYGNNPNPYNNQPRVNYSNNPNILVYPLNNQNINLNAFDSAEVINLNNNSTPQVDPYAQQQINRGIAAGFGQFFFNALDPNIAKTNVPLKLQSSKHIQIIVVTVILIGGAVGGAILVPTPETQSGGIALFVVPYLLYLIISICWSHIRGYITNLKKFDDYSLIYQKMTKGRGYFHFWIECYHYRTVKTKNGTRRQKVVTHTASQNFFPQQSIDESGNITGIKDITKYVFIDYLKRFYFNDSNSQQNFNRAYQSFIDRNRRDQYQNYTQTFQIEGFQPEVGFCMLGDSPHNSIIFYLITFLGLNLPYCCILERSVSRYSINILKRLIC